jgi:hypothetical protein
VFPVGDDLYCTIFVGAVHTATRRLQALENLSVGVAVEIAGADADHGDLWVDCLQPGR